MKKQRRSVGRQIGGRALTRSQVRFMRHRVRTGKTLQRDEALRYQMSEHTISFIVRGIYYQDVPGAIRR